MPFSADFFWANSLLHHWRISHIDNSSVLLHRLRTFYKLPHFKVIFSPPLPLSPLPPQWSFPDLEFSQSFLLLSALTMPATCKPAPLCRKCISKATVLREVYTIWSCFGKCFHPLSASICGI